MSSPAWSRTSQAWRRGTGRGRGSYRGRGTVRGRENIAPERALKTYTPQHPILSLQGTFERACASPTVTLNTQPDAEASYEPNGNDIHIGSYYTPPSLYDSEASCKPKHSIARMPLALAVVVVLHPRLHCPLAVAVPTCPTVGGREQARGSEH